MSIKSGGIFVFGAAVTIGLMTSCGKKSEDDSSNPVSMTDIANDPSLTATVTNESIGEAISAGFDQGATTAGLALSGLSLNGTTTKTCAVDGRKAVVSISSEINSSDTKTVAEGRATMAKTTTGKSSTTRTWSRTDNVAVACDASNTNARVDLKSPTNLMLEVAFTRERNSSRTLTSARGQKQRGSSFNASGVRTVTWLAPETAETSTSYFRMKSVVSQVSRASSVTNKDGETKDMSLMMNVGADSPLRIEVERAKTGDAVLSKRFASGKTVSTKDSSEGTIETTFSNLKINIVSGVCTPVSGGATIVFKDSAGTAIKTYTMTAAGADNVSLRDSSGVEVEDFALDSCDVEDLKM